MPAVFLNVPPSCRAGFALFPEAGAIGGDGGVFLPSLEADPGFPSFTVLAGAAGEWPSDVFGLSGGNTELRRLPVPAVPGAGVPLGLTASFLYFCADAGRFEAP